MANPKEYTPARRVAMQFALWGILAASLGLAAIVDGQLGGVGVMKLGPEQHSRQIRFQLPGGWTADLQPRDDPRIVAIAAEMKDTGRALTVYKAKIRRDMPPLFYLEDSGLAGEIFGRRTPPATPVTVAGADAILIRAHLIVQERNLEAEETEMVVCAVYPLKGTSDRVAVTLWLTDRGDSTGADLQLIKQIAGSVKVEGQ